MIYILSECTATKNEIRIEDFFEGLKIMKRIEQMREEERGENEAGGEKRQSE